jgi:hypothetical protein
MTFLEVEQLNLLTSKNSIGNVINNRGYIISADCPIYVSVRYNVTNQAGAFTSKGAAGLGARLERLCIQTGLYLQLFRQVIF